MGLTPGVREGDPCGGVEHSVWLGLSERLDRNFMCYSNFGGTLETVVRTI